MLHGQLLPDPHLLDAVGRPLFMVTAGAEVRQGVPVVAEELRTLFHLRGRGRCAPCQRDQTPSLPTSTTMRFLFTLSRVLGMNSNLIAIVSPRYGYAKENAKNPRKSHIAKRTPKDPRCSLLYWSGQ